MDGNRLQQLIYRGDAAAAKKIGLPYDVYRSNTPVDVLDLTNKVTALPVAFYTRTRPFKVPQQYKEAVWLLIADGRLLQVRDFLVGPYGTFYVGAQQPNLPIEVVKCNHTAVSIHRPGYSTVGSIIPAMTQLAANLPFFSQLTRVDIKNPQFGAATAGVAISHWAAFIPMAQGTLKQHDIITDEEGIQYEVDAPDFTNLGYVANIRLTTP